MNAKSAKRVFGLAASAVGTSGLMMLAPTMANAATAHSAHAQTVSSTSRASDGCGCQHQSNDYGSNNGLFRSFGFDRNNYQSNDYASMDNNYQSDDYATDEDNNYQSDDYAPSENREGILEGLGDIL
jgi:hypothetical protein